MPRPRQRGRPAADRARGSPLGRRVDARPARLPRLRPPKRASSSSAPTGARRSARAIRCSRLASGSSARVPRFAAARAARRDAPRGAVLGSSDAPRAGARVAAIAARSEGNPLFASELLAATFRGETAFPPALRDFLLADVARLVGRPLRPAGRGRGRARRALRAAPRSDAARGARARRGAARSRRPRSLLPDQAAGTFRFRHALSRRRSTRPSSRASARCSTSAWRARSPRAGLAMSGAAAAEAAGHWVAAGRPAEALAASLQATKEAEEVCGLTEALGHVEQVLALWDPRPGRGAARGCRAPGRPLPGGRARERLGRVEVDRRRAPARRRARPRARVDAETVADRLGVALDGRAMARGARALRPRRAAGRGLPRRPAGHERGEQALPGRGRARERGGATARRPSTRRGCRRSATPTRASAPRPTIRRCQRRRRRVPPPADPGCGNDHLLAALVPIKRALLRYELVYMTDPERIERSAAQHDAIIAALERGNHAEAAGSCARTSSPGCPT